MKITKKTDLPTLLYSKALNPLPDPDPLPKPSFRNPRKPGLRLKKDGPSSGKRSRPETPLLHWKFEEKQKKSPPKISPESGRKVKGTKEGLVSTRKLAAQLWRLHLPVVVSQPNNDGFQFRASVSHQSKRFGSHAKDVVQSPHSVTGPINGFCSKHEPSLQFSHSAMEGATKWDPACRKTSDEIKLVYGHSNPLNKKAAVPALEMELEQARTRIHELETERRSSKKKLEQFLKKLSEERATWRSREHEKIRAIIDDIKSDLNRERKSRQRMEIVNSKLVNELADCKLSAKRFMQDYEKERKGRELIEEVCDELAKEIGEDKAEVEALKRDSMKLREEVDDERRMLQMAEVWREERVQMKLVDAKLMLEEKYSKMNLIVENLEEFLSSKDSKPEKKVEILKQAAAEVNIQDMRDFTYEPPTSDDIFSVFEDVNFGEPNVRDIEPSPASHASKMRNGDVEDDESGWETASHPEDQGSTCSPDGETPKADSGEVYLVPNGELKKVSSISRLWKSNGEKFKIISVDGRLSNGTTISPDRDFSGQWSSPESGNPHITRGMKGCIEWPRSTEKNSLKSKLLEARIDSRKIQLRHVLKQKI